MQLTHLIDSIDPAHGGPTAVVLRLAAAQAGLGHEVVIISGDDAMPAKAREDLAAIGLDPDKSLARFDPEQGLGETDFLHLHGVWDRVIARGAALARKRGVPYAVTPHGMLDPWCLAQKPLKKKLALSLYVRRMINYAAFIHVLNADEGALIQPLGLTAKPVTIPNGVSLDEIDPLPKPGGFRAAFPQVGDDPIILFLSRLHFKKGLDHLAEAFRQISDAHPDAWLVVAGPDGGALKPFQDHVRQLGIDGRVLLTGPLYGQAKYQALVDADCFCLPSRQEGFSIAITEALACSLPVVISENCHFPEVAQVGAGVVCPLSSAAVGQALVELLGDTARAGQMGRAGRELIESRFTWPRIAERCVQAYRGEL